MIVMIERRKRSFPGSRCAAARLSYCTTLLKKKEVLGTAPLNAFPKTSKTLPGIQRIIIVILKQIMYNRE